MDTQQQKTTKQRFINNNWILKGPGVVIPLIFPNLPKRNPQGSHVNHVTRRKGGSHRLYRKHLERDPSESTSTQRGDWKSIGCLEDVPDRKLGSMVSKWVISPTYKWGVLGLQPTY